MIEQILTRKNLLQAMRKVQKNHGSAGVAHMPVCKLPELLSIDKEELKAKVRSGNYLPQPILGVAQSPILGTTITVERLMNRGYVSMLDIYTSISPQLNEPLYTRPVRTVV